VPLTLAGSLLVSGMLSIAAINYFGKTKPGEKYKVSDGPEDPCPNTTSETKFRFPEKSKTQKLIEGHLAVGLLYFRRDFGRSFRVFTLVVVYQNLILNTGVVVLVAKLHYFVCGVLGMLCTVPLRLGMNKCMTYGHEVSSNWVACAVCSGVCLIMGNITGIIVVTHSLRGSSELLNTSVVCSILLEFFVLETLLTVIRYFYQRP